MSNVNKLPDCYAKKGSNNEKLLLLNELAVSDAKTDARAIFDSLDIQNATGHTLDLYGETVGQSRGALNDIQYRILILTRIGINTVQGDYPTTMQILSQIFNCNPKEIILRDGDKDCTVVIKTFPLDILVNAGFSSGQAIELIESLLPVGVTIDGANFNGTFEFSDSADEYDETAGFANVEQTIGGYLGLLLDDEGEGTILPF
jgi:hypothetical protein